MEMEPMINRLFNKKTEQQLRGEFKTNRSRSLFLLYAAGCFKCKKYNKCLNFLLEIKNLDKGKMKSKTVISTTFQFIELFSHLELGNIQIIPSLLKSIQYAVDVKQNVFSEEENEIIRIIRSIIKKEPFTIDPLLYDDFGITNHYKIFFPYLEEKQKELE